MKIRLVILVLASLLLQNCGPTLQVFTDYDKSADISDYRYYYWPTEQAIEAKGHNPLYYNELNDRRIKNSVDKQLQARGFILMKNSQAIEMHYHIMVENKTMVTQQPLEQHYNTYWLDKNVNTYPYEEGTLIIDLMDVSKKVLVWRGWATGVIEPEMRQKPEEAINLAVKKIFKKFPYSHY